MTLFCYNNFAIYVVYLFGALNLLIAIKSGLERKGALEKDIPVRLNDYRMESIESKYNFHSNFPPESVSARFLSV